MSGKAKTSGVSRSAVGDDNDRGDSEPKTKKQRLLTAASVQNAETEEELYQKAIALVFGGELYAKLLRYAGPEGIAHLRGDQKWRKAMDDLPADDLRALKLPVVERPDDVDLTLLRQMLTEPISSAYPGQDSGWTLSELGWKILVKSPLTSNAVIEGMISSDCGAQKLKTISFRPSNSVEILTKLLCLVKPGLFWNIAHHLNASSEILSAVLLRGANDDLTISGRVATNLNTGPLDLHFLSEHGDRYVRRDVASNTSTPEYVLRKLSADREVTVRVAVATNPRTPRDMLISLSIDASEQVRIGVAVNPNAGLDLLSRLALDDSDAVLEFLAENRKKDFDVIFNEARKNTVH